MAISNRIALVCLSFLLASSPAAALEFTYLDPIAGSALVYEQVSVSCFLFECTDGPPPAISRVSESLNNRSTTTFSAGARISNPTPWRCPLEHLAAGLSPTTSMATTLKIPANGTSISAFESTSRARFDSWADRHRSPIPPPACGSLADSQMDPPRLTFACSTTRRPMSRFSFSPVSRTRLRPSRAVASWESIRRPPPRSNSLSRRSPSPQRLCCSDLGWSGFTWRAHGPEPTSGRRTCEIPQHLLCASPNARGRLSA